MPQILSIIGIYYYFPLFTIVFLEKKSRRERFLPKKAEITYERLKNTAPDMVSGAGFFTS
jgi:hypothetical protein